jgi:MFS family permease
MSESPESVSLSISPPQPSIEPLKLGALFAVLYFVQGMGEPVAGLVAQPVRSLLRSWGEGAAYIAAFSAAVSIPWSLKPLYGLLSDFVPIAGFKRKSYLLLTSLIALAGFAALFLFKPTSSNYTLFLLLLIAPTVGLAFGDVLVDALMVEKGQPLGMTGVLQSVQWAASYGATLLTGVIGGFLSQHGIQYTAFLICAGLALITFIMAWKFVDEKPKKQAHVFAETWKDIREAARSPVLLGVAGFLFLWNFEPLSQTVIYINITETLGWSEQFYGYTLSLLAVGCIVGSIAYGVYCRKVSMPILTHTAILLGIVSQLSYWRMATHGSAVVIHLVVGFTWMTALLIQFDLAARVCPRRAAATVFAILMALTNMASSLGVWLGGRFYGRLLDQLPGSRAFFIMVILAAAVKTSCWLLFFLPSRWAEGRRSINSKTSKNRLTPQP